MLLPVPSAMFADMLNEHLLNWEVSEYVSSLGKLLVILYIFLPSSNDSFQTSSFLKSCIFNNILIFEAA